MNTDVELALMSISAYQSTRDPINRLIEPIAWTPLKDDDLPGISTRLASIGLSGTAWHVTAGNGFEAVAYQKGAEGLADGMTTCPKELRDLLTP